MPLLALNLALAALVAAHVAACAERTESVQLRGDERTRNEILEGARRDFEPAIHGPAGFEDCFIARFERKLTPQVLNMLIETHQQRGEPAAARSLNGLGAPVGDACGGRRWVPQLTEAATALKSGR